MNRAEAIAFAREQRKIFGGKMGEFLEFVESELTHTNTSNTLNALDCVDTISRQAAIDALCDNCNYPQAKCAHFPCDQFVSIEQLPSAEPRWIPVTERLPEEDYLTGANVQHSAEVLMTVCNTEGEETIIDYGRTVNGRWYSDITDCLVPVWWEVTAWMPLPQPWKGADDD